MGRIRTVKPELFRHDALFEAEQSSGLPLRIAFVGIFTVADRAGRFRWRPRQLKLDVLPFDEVDFERVLDTLRSHGFIVGYESGGEQYGAIPTWHKHQVINNREQQSSLPEPPPVLAGDASGTREAHVPDATGTHYVQVKGEGEGEGEGELERKVSVASQPRRQRNAADETGDSIPTVPCPYSDIVDLYHETLPSLPRAKLMQPSRQRALRKLWGWVLSTSKPDGERRATSAPEALAWLGGYFARASENDFLMGRTGRAGAHATWQCDLDFLLTEKGMKQVIEKTEAA